MAKGFKTGGRDFVKGVVTNPKGRPKVSAQLKELKLLNSIKLAELLNEYIHLNKKTLIERSNDPNTPAIELLICSILVGAVKNGDPQRGNFLLDRLVGKVKEQVEHSSDGFKVILEDYLSKKDD